MKTCSIQIFNVSDFNLRTQFDWCLSVQISNFVIYNQVESILRLLFSAFFTATVQYSTVQYISIFACQNVCFWNSSSNEKLKHLSTNMWYYWSPKVATVTSVTIIIVRTDLTPWCLWYIPKGIAPSNTQMGDPNSNPSNPQHFIVVRS